MTFDNTALAVGTATSVPPPLTPAPALADLSERYTRESGVVFMSGNQALVRLSLQQRVRDQHAGLRTAGFISGYRGSPLGRFDMELWQAGKLLKQLDIHFQPGVNEDLAATAVWGTQYVPILPGPRVDGVFGIWYGKGPGVDRSGDAFQHANTAGTAPLGGVIALVGDDHAAKSSSRAGQSDFQLKACGMPLLYPSSVQEVLDFGLHGIAMSRYSGCWVAMKLVTDVVETTSRVDLDLERVCIATPPLPTQPAGGLHIRPNEPALEMEARLYEHKIPAALAYARANGLNRVMLAPATPKLGIVSAGKSWGDVLGALALLGLDMAAAEAAEKQGAENFDKMLAFRLREHWQRPADALAGAKADIVVQFAKDGTITNALVATSSGNADVDQSIIKAASDLAKIPEMGSVAPNIYVKYLQQRRISFQM